jgi:hypothetical protein
MVSWEMRESFPADEKQFAMLSQKARWRWDSIFLNDDDQN